MNKPVFALVSATFLGFALPLLAAPYGGGGGGGHGGHGGPPGAVARPGYGGPYVGVRPGYGGYPGYGYAGWRGGYWGPRVGVYYGGPGYYWGAWPGAWGWGAWAASYAYPYNVAPIVINSTPQTQLFTQQEPAANAAPQVVPEVSYWYYCIRPAGYFPYVKDCSEPWLKVVPQATGEHPSAPRVAP